MLSWLGAVLTANDKQAFVSLHKMHARERSEMVISILDAKIKEEGEEFHAYFSTLSTYCEQHGLQEDMEKATEILEKLVQTEQRKNEAMHKDKESKCFEPTSDRMWAGLTSIGPSTRTTQRSRSRSGSRSLSRSPRGREYQPQDFGRDRGRGVFRGRNPRRNYRGNFRGRGFRGNYCWNARGNQYRGSSIPRSNNFNMRSHGGIEVRNLNDHEL